MSDRTGDMMNRLRNSASPARTWLGGIVVVPNALRVSESTTTILVKDVHSTRIAGATDSTVSSRMMLTVWLGLPRLGSTTTDTPGLVVGFVVGFGGVGAAGAARAGAAPGRASTGAAAVDTNTVAGAAADGVVACAAAAGPARPTRASAPTASTRRARVGQGRSATTRASLAEHEGGRGPGPAERLPGTRGARDPAGGAGRDLRGRGDRPGEDEVGGRRLHRGTGRRPVRLDGLRGDRQVGPGELGEDADGPLGDTEDHHPRPGLDDLDRGALAERAAGEHVDRDRAPTRTGPAEAALGGVAGEDDEQGEDGAERDEQAQYGERHRAVAHARCRASASLTTSVTRTANSSSTTTTSPRAMRVPLTSTSTGLPAARSSSSTTPGARASTSCTVIRVRPSSTLMPISTSRSRCRRRGSTAAGAAVSPKARKVAAAGAASRDG